MDLSILSQTHLLKLAPYRIYVCHYRLGLSHLPVRTERLHSQSTDDNFDWVITGCICMLGLGTVSEISSESFIKIKPKVISQFDLKECRI